MINGQKIWTSQGGQATHMFALVRTEPDAPKHQGISYLLLDLDQPGITRTPIRQMTGESGFFQFFFDDATTPASWIVGERGDGWNVSRTTLKHERASIGSADALGGTFAKLVELAGEVKRNGRPAIKDPEIRQALTRIEGWVMAHRASSYRLMSNAVAGDDAGAIGLMMKLLLTETGHEMALLAEELIGDQGLIEPAPAGVRGRGPERWLDQIMGSLGNSIAAGPPAGLTSAQLQVYKAGALVVGESGCLACHELGDNGNNGPGPPLTHIGSIRRPGAIAATLVNPTAPMPSFVGLAKNSPKKFADLVQFLSMLQ